MLVSGVRGRAGLSRDKDAGETPALPGTKYNTTHKLPISQYKKFNALVQKGRGRASIKRKMRLLKKFISTGKDKIISKIIRLTADYYITKKGYGRVVDIKIDSENKTISLKALLKGEAEEIAINISGYDFKNVGDKKTFTFEDIVTSREWVNVLIKNYFTQREFEIPKNVPVDLLKTIF